MWSSSTFWEFAHSYIATARLLSVLSALDLLFSVIFKACGTVSWLTARVDRSQPACVVLSDRSPPHCLTSRWASTAGRPKLLETSQSSRACASEREKEIRMCHKNVSQSVRVKCCVHMCVWVKSAANETRSGLRQWPSSTEQKRHDWVLSMQPKWTCLHKCISNRKTGGF